MRLYVWMQEKGELGLCVCDWMNSCVYCACRWLVGGYLRVCVLVYGKKTERGSVDVFVLVSEQRGRDPSMSVLVYRNQREWGDICDVCVFVRVCMYV